MGVLCTDGPLQGHEVSPELGDRWPYVHPQPFYMQPYPTWGIGWYLRENGAYRWTPPE